MTRDDGVEQSVKKPAPAWIWPALVIGLLGIHALTWVGFTLIAVGDPTFSVEPDHYQKSLRWDQISEERRQSDALGWTAVIDPESIATVLGERRLVCRLAARDGEPLVGATVEVEIFHHARGDDRLTTVLSDEGDGRYGGLLRMKRPGLWECRLRARRGDATFVEVMHHEVRDGQRSVR